MSYLTNINLQVYGQGNQPKTGISAMINYPAGGALIQSGTASGFYQFTGLNAGSYDVTVISNGVNYVTAGYVVQNSFLIPVGESSIGEEGRTYIRSQEVVQNAGILMQSQNTSSLYDAGNASSAPITVTSGGTPTGTGYVPATFSIGLPVGSGSSVSLVQVYSTQNMVAKQTGDRTYHSNQNTTFSQKLRMTVP